MFNWLSNKVLHDNPPPVRRTPQPAKKSAPKGDEDFAYQPSLSAGAIEVQELSINEFLHHFKQK